jgi:hypothetical protein
MLSATVEQDGEVAMRVLLAAGLLMLSGCGGGGSTTGTNYSEPPPMAVIVATPTPAPSASPDVAPVSNRIELDDSAGNQ